ncbi:hypothetical protein JZ785_08170 [Alicyclobacillus curvatus]|nr:hypothetical protein JZ785_08170 [Alicyclobacillus curvatus]
MSSTQVGQSAGAEGLPQRALRGVARVVLLVIVPLIAALLVIGGSLQIIGVPVWQTTLGYIRGHSLQAGSPAAAQQSAVNELKTENASLKQQVSAFEKTLNAKKAQVQSLQTELNAANLQVSAKRSALLSAKQEATIVTQMDPAAAAKVVAKLPQQEAGLVLAVLSPGVSSQVLAQMDPATAAKLLQLAGSSNVNTANSSGP